MMSLAALPNTVQIAHALHDTLVTVVHDSVLVAVPGPPSPSPWERAWPVLLGAVVAIFGGFGAQWFRLFLERRDKRRALSDIMTSDLGALGEALDHVSEEWAARKGVSMQTLAVIDFVAANYREHRAEVGLLGPVFQNRVNVAYRELAGWRESLRYILRLQEDGQIEPPEKDVERVFTNIGGLKALCDDASTYALEAWAREFRLENWWDMTKIRASVRWDRILRRKPHEAAGSDDSAPPNESDTRLS